MSSGRGVVQVLACLGEFPVALAVPVLLQWLAPGITLAAPAVQAALKLSAALCSPVIFARRPDYAQQFMDRLPQAELVWVDECGHCAHLEQPQALLQAVARFTGLGEAAGEAAELCEAAA